MTITLDARMITNSGIGRYIKALIPSLITESTQLFILGKTKELLSYSSHSNVTIINIDKPIYSISEQIALFLKSPACDIFISPHYNVPFFIPQAKKVAVIIPDVNHLVFKKELSLLKRAYAKFFYNLASGKDILFTISEFSKAEIIKFTKCNPDKIIVAKCAIDKKHFQKLSEDSIEKNLPQQIIKYNEEDYILYIGNVKPHKNLKRTLLAFNELSDKFPNLKFLIVGKKDKFLTGDNELDEVVNAHQNLKEKVIFTGLLSDLHLAYLYKNSKLFLFPSLYEGFGLPPLEAMFFGCPVIVSREGSLPEICGNAAYYCDAYDVKNIAKSIVNVLENNQVRADLIKNGYEKLKEYEWDFFNQIIISKLKKPN